MLPGVAVAPAAQLPLLGCGWSFSSALVAAWRRCRGSATEGRGHCCTRQPTAAASSQHHLARQRPRRTGASAGSGRLAACVAGPAVPAWRCGPCPNQQRLPLFASGTDASRLMPPAALVTPSIIAAGCKGTLARQQASPAVVLPAEVPTGLPPRPLQQGAAPLLTALRSQAEAAAVVAKSMCGSVAACR